MTTLVTGAAGFIGNAVALALAARGDDVVGVDNLNAYYDPALKRARLKRLDGLGNFAFEKLDLADREATAALFARLRPGRVVHMAAQAGVRHGIDHPHDYADANLTGFLNVLEGCRHAGAGHLLYASSSSVYGANASLPYGVGDNVDHPLSLYAATKKANELMAHAYAHLYGLPVTGLRFFTVYGPWGRPDMAPIRFASGILEDRPIEVYNEGRHARDFTYIDDVVDGVLRVLDQPAMPDPQWSAAAPDPAGSSAPYRLYNIGNSAPVELMDFIAALEEALGRKATLKLMPMQPGDVETTFADVSALRRDFGYAPAMPLKEGIARFAAWYRDYYGA
ncbi:MAG: NAD-dependent epimerase [Flavobacteriaceae bacterium]